MHGNLVHIAKVGKPSVFRVLYKPLSDGRELSAYQSGRGWRYLIQHSDLLRRKDPAEIDDGKVRVENPEFQLTALYFEQEFRKNQTIPMSDELKETYERCWCISAEENTLFRHRKSTAFQF